MECFDMSMGYMLFVILINTDAHYLSRVLTSTVVV